MHKQFYASGFFYYPSTQQILLQQHKSLAPKWSLFEEKSQKDEEPVNAFLRGSFKQFKIKITPKAIHDIYDYFNTELNSHYHIFYARVKNKKEIREKPDYNIEWFTFQQISKLPLNEQTRQDIMVGKRVIDAALRNKEEKKRMASI